jgi:hypothetical protein
VGGVGAGLVVGAARRWSSYWKRLDGAHRLVRVVFVVGVSVVGERSKVSTGGERCRWLASLVGCQSAAWLAAQSVASG